MPNSYPTDYVQGLNALQKQPRTLYRIQVDREDPTKDLFLCEGREAVDFYRLEPDGAYAAQTYRPFPIQRGAIGQNADAQVDTLEISASNVSRTLGAHLLQRDGLRGNRVDVWTVFADCLDDPDARASETFYVDAASANESEVSLQLSSKLDVLNVELPLGRFRRNFCRHRYKGQGCWLPQGDGTYAPGASFSTDTTRLTPATKVVFSRTYDTITEAQLRFGRKDLSFLEWDDASRLVLDVMATTDNVAGLDMDAGWVGIGCHDTDTRDARFPIAGQPLSLDEWTTWNVPLGDPTFAGGALDLGQVRRIEVHMVTPTGAPVRFKARDARIVAATSARFEAGEADTCRRTLDDCRRHNNEARFGGFPAIPGRRMLS